MLFLESVPFIDKKETLSRNKGQTAFPFSLTPYLFRGILEYLDENLPGGGRACWGVGAKSVSATKKMNLPLDTTRHRLPKPPAGLS
jgi:hypothetical protein